MGQKKKIDNAKLERAWGALKPSLYPPGTPDEIVGMGEMIFLKGAANALAILDTTMTGSYESLDKFVNGLPQDMPDAAVEDKRAKAEAEVEAYIQEVWGGLMEEVFTRIPALEKRAEAAMARAESRIVLPH